MTFEIHVPASNRRNTVVVLNRLTCIQPHINNVMLKGNTFLNQQ